MRTAENVTDRIARLAMRLFAYHIEEARYRLGKANATVDCLSTYPIPEIAIIESNVNLCENMNSIN
jgi:hypothetical protein